MSARVSFRTSIAAFVVVACVAAGCSKSSSNGDGGAAAPATNPACTCAPLKFTSIGTLSGPLSLPSLTTEAENGQQAALRAVNGECALGRPIQLTVCDD